MKKLFTLFVLVLLVNVNSPAQYFSNQNKVWAFGQYCGLNFTTGTPDTFTTSIYTIEGSASVSDNFGNLLFYTDGRQVWNRSGTLMPSGASIFSYSTISTSQASVIVPVLNNPDQYYVFSLEQYTGITTDSSSHLSYCIVDMTLNSGMGDVLTTSMPSPITSKLSEKMIAVPGNDCNIWLLVHRRDTAKFLAYEITNAGINLSPVVSTVGGVPQDGLGVMKISPDRLKLVAMHQQYPSTGTSGTELYDFDPNSGIISNVRLLNTYDLSYGAEFSPDNTKLYATNSQTPSYVRQYDISLLSLPAIIASEYIVSTTSLANFFDLKLAPDGKIYGVSAYGLTTSGSDFIDCISAPNLSGSSCNYISGAIHLGGFCLAGFPNLFWAGWRPVPSIVLCEGATYNLSGTSPVGAWSSNNTTVATVGAGTGIVTGLSIGTTLITYSAAGGCSTTAVTTTTVIVKANNAGIIISKDTVCIGTAYEITMSDSVSGGIWSCSNTSLATIDSISGVTSGLSTGTVTITYKVANSCGTYTATKLIHIVSAAHCVSGIAEHAIPLNAELKIFPNPNTGIFKVDLLSDINEEVHIVITNITGETTKEITTASNRLTEINLDGATGIYLLFVTTSRARYIAKILAN